MKKIFLLCLFVIISAILVEIFFHVLNYEIKLDTVSPYLLLREGDTDNFIKQHYLEIYEPFFCQQEDYYIKQRNSIIFVGEQKFSKVKDNNIKRIFIVGESVAAYYNINLLQKNLKEFVPNQKFEIINAGMGSYDSYRIEKILKEISDNYEPDYIIMMLGNNDGHLYNPININYLPYKYKIFRSSYILNAISNIVMPRYKYDMSNVFPFFQHNVEKIIKDVNSKCPIIFVTLPENKDIYNTDEFKKRRDFIRTLSNKYEAVYIADFDKVLKSFIENPKYDVFIDNVHYQTEFYDLISKLVICEIYNEIDNDIKNNINKKYIFSLLDKNIDLMFINVKKDIKKYNFNNLIEYIKNINKDINNNDDYRKDLLKSLIWMEKIYNDYYFINSNFEEDIDEMINKYSQKEIFYIFKALIFFRMGKQELFEQNINAALQINSHIVQKNNIK